MVSTANKYPANEEKTTLRDKPILVISLKSEIMLVFVAEVIFVVLKKLNALRVQRYFIIQYY